MLASSDRNQEFRIVLCKTVKTDSFGFSVFGGLGSVLPVVVSEIKENSIADQCGQLEVGDILVEANGLRLLENVLSTLEVSRYLQAQPTLTLELKIRKDPVIRRKTLDILRDPGDFEKISLAVSPDNLHSLKRLTIQSTHTHQLERREDLLGDNKRTTFQSACNLLARTISHGSNLSDDSSTSSVREYERKQRLDWSTNNCYPGYATIRRTPTKNKEDKESIAKSMPSNVDLIGQSKTIKLSQSPEEEVFNDTLLTGASLHRSLKAPSEDYKDMLISGAAEQTEFSVGAKCGEKFMTQEVVNLPSRRSQRGASLLASDVEGDGGLGPKELLSGGAAECLKGDQTTTHKRSLSPEIKEAIALADPSSCWADYFPESISFISSASSNHNSCSNGSGPTCTVVQTTTTHSSPVQKYSILTQTGNSNYASNNVHSNTSTTTNSEQLPKSVVASSIGSLMNETPNSGGGNLPSSSFSCPSTAPSSNQTQNKSPATSTTSGDNRNISNNHLCPITPPPLTPSRKKSAPDSLTDEEMSPYQQTQHFNSPVLGASERTLFFNSDHFDAPSSSGVKTSPTAVSVNSNSSSALLPATDATSGICTSNRPQSCAGFATGDSSACSLSTNSSASKQAGAVPQGSHYLRANCVRRDSFEKENGEIDDEDDSPVGQCYILKSLEIAAPAPAAKPTPEVDLAAAKRLATRLFYLNGFDRSDVPKHLGKKQDFSQAVATEYFKFYDFYAERVDVSLRKFFLNLFLCGDTQERERILSHFSRRYFDCNPTVFPSFESVDYLVTAVVLLNQDLNTMQAGSRTSMGVRPMTAEQFVTNVITKPQPLHILHCNPEQPPEEYSEYSRQLLTDLYYSIKDEPLLCAVCPMPPAPDNMGSTAVPIPTDSSMLSYSQGTAVAVDGAINQLHPKFIGNVDSAILSQQTQFNMAAANFTAGLPTCSGYLNRKWLFEADLKKTGKLKRSWKHWYVKLQGLDLIHHKSREDSQKSSGGEQKAVILSLHHCLALPVNAASADLSQSEIEICSQDFSSLNDGVSGSNSKSKKSSSTKSKSKSSASASSSSSSSSSSVEQLQVSKWDFTLRTADWAEFQFRCRGKQEMNEWIGAINLVAAHSSPPLMAPIANNPVPSAPTSETTESQEKKSSRSSSSAYTFSSSSTPNAFQKHFKPAAFTNLKIQDQIAVWGDWVNKSEIEHAEAMRRHANLPSSTSKSVVQTTEQEIVYYEFEVQRYQCYQEALIESLNNARSVFCDIYGSSDAVPSAGQHPSLHITRPGADLHHQKTTGATPPQSPFSINECSSDMRMTPNTACVQYPNMQTTDALNQQTPSGEFMNVPPEMSTPPMTTTAQIPRLFPKKPAPPGLSHNAVDYGVL